MRKLHIIACMIAGVALRYVYDKYILEQKVHKKVKDSSIKSFKKGKKCFKKCITT